MKNILKFTAFVFVFLLAGCGDSNKNADTTATDYYCPMHPEVHSDRPGVCPICNMDLVLKTDTKAATEMVTGEFQLSKDEMLKANIITELVSYSEAAPEIKVLGKIEIPEENIKTISAKFSGRVEKLFIGSTGISVSTGTPLFESYSDEIIRLFTEYMSVYNSGNSTETIKLLSSIKERLFLRGITAEQISQLENSELNMNHFAVYSPYKGYIVEKSITEGEYFQEGKSLFKIADLSTLWVVADVYAETDQFVKVGKSVTIQNERLTRSFTGIVSFVSPVIDKNSRSLRVRVEVKNNGKLIPNSFVTVVIKGNKAKIIAIPANALVRTGTEDIVWVQSSETGFMPRKVLVGEKSGEKYIILSGLTEGEKIVTNGVYLLDSETRLRNFTGGAEASAPTMPGHNHVSLDKKADISSIPQAKLLGKTDLKAFNTVCPILGDEVSNNNPKVEYNGQIWGFCCPGCDKKFASDPVKYSQNLSSDGKKYLGIYED